MKAFRQSKDAEDRDGVRQRAAEERRALGSCRRARFAARSAHYPPEVFEIVAPALRELAADEAPGAQAGDVAGARSPREAAPEEGRQDLRVGQGRLQSRATGSAEVGQPRRSESQHDRRIRTERDLLESILFPSTTPRARLRVADDRDRRWPTSSASIRRNLPDTVVMADASGLEHTIPRAQIISMQTAAGCL